MQQPKQWIAAMASLILLLTACGSDETPQAGKTLTIAKSPTGFIPSSPQRSGDPKTGYDALINKAYVTCGIPYSAYKKSGLYHPPKYTLAGRNKLNTQLPYYQTYYQKENVDLVVNNCLFCHASPFNDQLIIGLGNESLDLTQDFAANVESIGVYVEGEQETAEWRRWADRVSAISPYIRTDTIGVNSAVNMTWALFAHRDPKTLNWSNKPLIDPPSKKPLPVSVPPWWRMQKVNAMFYSASGRGDHARLEILASTLCTDTVEEAQSIDSYAPDIRAYIASIAPPVYPFSINQELASQGKQVFDNYCARCHGTYGNNGHYPNLVIPFKEIGTDPEYITAALGKQLKQFGSWLAQSFYGEHSHLEWVPGYLAPPLDGIWATAPYLHNGSIPTIEALLNSAARPQYWTRNFDNSKDYNEQTLGWNYTKLAYGKADTSDPEQRKRLYDTTLQGYSNSGHTFGDGLTTEERQQILEYLKTL